MRRSALVLCQDFFGLEGDGVFDLDGDLVGVAEPLGTTEPDGVGVTDGVGVGDGVTDGFGFGPLLSAAATAALYAASECPIDLPLTRTVGVPVIPSLLARSVTASTSGT